MSIVFFLAGVLVASISQVLLKKSADKTHKSFLSEYLNPHVIIGYGLFFGSTLLIIYGYRGLPLKYGPVLESAGYIFVLILGQWFFKERMTVTKLCGTLLIISGIIVFSV